jgi:hypothetical protein
MIDEPCEPFEITTSRSSKMQELQPTHAMHVLPVRDYSVHANWSDLIKTYRDTLDLECPFCHVGEG